ncbi:hypothetical protein DYBT9275_02874 [Dyadobacter sp. CECT 9275]|uniref:Exo-alpha-sialidase n=1 Tax=Dyadobacter helix TaxID=2822344 RepID=A0A916JDU8_9BACT|nr:hypothetical protein [Dyadobacter sp. CECT 9275]CAG5002358.1 hypothetical protein DYBT9275_02874 [Dyadobacter sp. CECT 9275]
MLKVTRYLLIFLLSGYCHTWANAAIPADSISITRVWDKEQHNAFPDLIQFKDYFYITFREGANHVGNENNGKVRIIRSKNRKDWESVALFDMDAEDVREARLSLRPDGTLMAIVAAGIFKDGKYLTLAPYVSFSDKTGTHFSTPEKTTFSKEIAPALDWIWRITWHKGIGYGIMYSVDYKMVDGKRVRTMYAQLLRTKDGKSYEKVPGVAINGSPNESTIRFDSHDNMYVLARRETDDQMGILAVSAFPYRTWEYHKLSQRLGGPNFQFMGKDRLVIGTRMHEGNAASTALHVTDLKGKILKTIKLPSGGDNSYPGMVLDKKILWVAYYSSHEGKAMIYLARVPVSDLKTK